MSVSIKTPVFSENAQRVLCERYLSKKANGRTISKCKHCEIIHETPEDMLRRVSFGNDEYYNLMASLDFLPNSPTLFNAGIKGAGTMSACFKFDIDDSMLGEDSIMDTACKAAAVQKWGGGVGFVLSNLRPKGAQIASTHGKACGPVAVLKMLHGVSEMITQGGKRAGAQMGILSVDHPDVREFIHCKDEDPQGLSTFNISVAVTDEFMHRATDFDTYGVIKERELLQEICESAWKTGDPGLYFIDEAERGNPTPWLGELSGTNPCGEVPLLNNEPCNLGSINLVNHVIYSERQEVSVDFERLAKTAYLATKFLDEILDHNVFPDERIDRAAKITRKLGLGVMGWADMLTVLGVHYDSEEAVELGEKVMKCIQDAASKASKELADEKGPYPGLYSHPNALMGEDILRGLGLWRRNATVTCIAPTGSIAILAGVSSGIEPRYALENTRTLGSGTVLTEKVDVGSIAGKDFFTERPFIPHTAHEVDTYWHIEHQAAFQTHVDLAVSKTINMREEISVKDIHSAYIKMWQERCKGGTVFRDGSRDKQVLVKQETYFGSMKEEAKQAEAVAAIKTMKVDPTPGGDEEEGPKFKVGYEFTPIDVKQYETDTHFHGRKKLPVTRPAVAHHFTIGDTEGYFHWGLYEDGSPGELFITASKQGSTIDGMMDAFAIVVSMALQYGVPLESVVEKLKNRRFEPSGLTGYKAIPSVTSIPDYIARWAEMRFLSEEPTTVDGREGEMRMWKDTRVGMFCPECGSEAVYQEGCMSCSSECGWMKC